MARIHLGNTKYRRRSSQGSNIVLGSRKQRSGTCETSCCRPSDNGSGHAFHGKHFLRSEEHTSELQSLMRISYAVFCLKKKREHYKKITKRSQVYTRIVTEQ